MVTARKVKPSHPSMKERCRVTVHLDEYALVSRYSKDPSPNRAPVDVHCLAASCRRARRDIVLSEGVLALEAGLHLSRFWRVRESSQILQRIHRFVPDRRSLHVSRLVAQHARPRQGGYRRVQGRH